MILGDSIVRPIMGARTGSGQAAVLQPVGERHARVAADACRLVVVAFALRVRKGRGGLIANDRSGSLCKALHRATGCGLC